MSYEWRPHWCSLDASSHGSSCSNAWLHRICPQPRSVRLLPTVLAASARRTTSCPWVVAQVWSVHSDAQSRTILVVLAIPVDLVGQNPFRIAAMSFSVTFDRDLQIAGFIEGIPIQLFNHGVIIDHADRYLGAKFDIGCRLAPDNRAYPGLVDADNPVFNFMLLLLVHLPLLAINIMNGLPIL